jgi:hypothetical protein
MVSRLQTQNADGSYETLGTCFRVKADEALGNVFTARHCVIDENGQLMDPLFAFDVKVEFVAAQASTDIALLRAPAGAGFLLSPFTPSHAARGVERQG